MKKIEPDWTIDRSDPPSRRRVRFRSGRTAAKYLLLASLMLPPGAATMGMVGTLAAPVFRAPAIDQFGGMGKPTRIAVSDDGQVYVSDTRRGIVAIFDSKGRRVGTLEGFGAPLGLGVSVLSRCGNFGCVCRPVKTTYVGDESDGSVSVFEEGRFVRMLGAGPGEFLKPNGIAVTSNQFSYVVDSGAHMVKMYAPDGSLHRTWGTRGWGDGQLDFPTDIAFDEVSGELFITELDNRRISVFSRDGDWLRSMYPPVNDQGDPVFYRIAGLGVGPSGNLYVVDSALATVSILTPDGALVETIGYQGGSYWTGDLKVPVDAATDGNLLFVTSSKDRLVKVFGATE